MRHCASKYLTEKLLYRNMSDKDDTIYIIIRLPPNGFMKPW